MATDVPSSMKAVQWSRATGGLEKNLNVNDNAALPKKAKSLPKDGVLVKVAYSTLNPVDYKLPEMTLLSSLLFSKPATPGNDYSGIVVASKNPSLKPGDRVFGLADPPSAGALGEYLVVSNKQGCVKLPDGVSLKDAAAVGVCALTAYQCIFPFVKSGGKVFINGGSGGTGTFGIQIAKAIGCTVTTSCSGPNVELCKSLGADNVIDYRTTDIVESLKRSGTQYDLIVDNVNTTALYWNAQHYLKPDGSYVNIAGDLNLPNFLNQLKMFLLPTWLGGGQRKARFVMCVANAEQFAQIAEWMKEGKVKTIIEKEYDLSETVDAFTRLKTGRTRGKLIVKVGRE